MAARLPRVVVGSVFALLTCAGSSAWGQALGPQQVLERLAVFNSGAVLEMSVDGSGITSPDFSDYGVTAATGFTACQLHPTRGLYCLDGREVRRWPDPTLGGVGPVEFSCANPSLPIDSRAQRRLQHHDRGARRAACGSRGDAAPPSS